MATSRFTNDFSFVIAFGFRSFSALLCVRYRRPDLRFLRGLLGGVFLPFLTVEGLIV